MRLNHNYQKVEDGEWPFARCVRRGLLWVIVAAACFVAYRIGNLYAEWQRVAGQRPTQRSLTARETAMAATIMPLAGKWSFGEVDWDFKSTVVGPDAVARSFEALQRPIAAAESRALPDVSQDLLDIVDMLQLQPVERDGLRVYRLQSPEFKAQLVTTAGDENAKTVGAACAILQAGDMWQLFEFTPKTLAAKNEGAIEHLLPLPTGAVRRAARFGDDGRMLLEMISLTADAVSIIASWRAAGWEVQPSRMGDSSGFSYLCARGSDVIYAWSASSRENMTSLMLVRSPSDAELGTFDAN